MCHHAPPGVFINRLAKKYQKILKIVSQKGQSRVLWRIDRARLNADYRHSWPLQTHEPRPRGDKLLNYALGDLRPVFYGITVSSPPILQ